MSTAVSRRSAADSPALALVAAAVVFLLWYGYYIHPLVGHSLVQAGDLEVHVRLVHSAKQALAAGQFPLQFANDASQKLQPIFLYYSPVFYTVAGVLEMTFKLGAYDALLLSIAVFALVAQGGLWLLLRELGCSRVVSALAFAVFATAPYFVTCLFARWAIAEFSFFCLLPLAVHAVLIQGRRPGFGSWLYCGLAFGLTILSHKIFTGWLLILLAVVHFLRVGYSPRKTILFGAAVGFGMFVTSAYWLNAWLSSRHLNIALESMDGYVAAYGHLHNSSYDGPPSRLGILWSVLTSNLEVFGIFPITNRISTTPHLHLQIGPLASLAFILAAWWGREKRLLWLLGLGLFLSVAVSCSFWQLFPFWRFVPGPLCVIQFPYRLLTFATLFGCVLVACLSDHLIGQRRYVALAGLVAAGAFQMVVFDWRPSAQPIQSKDVEATDVVRWDYTEPFGAPGLSDQVARVLPAGAVRFPMHNEVEIELTQPVVAGFVRLPVICSRNLRIFVDGQPVPFYQQLQSPVLRVTENTKVIRVRREERWSWTAAGLVSLVLLWLVVLFGFRPPGKPAVPDSVAATAGS